MPKPSLPNALAALRLSARLFLGSSPLWYKRLILAFLAANAALWLLSGDFPALRVAVGWALVLEFIFTLVMALRCYPLQPGGLLAVEAVALGMTSVEHVYAEAVHNFPVLLLMMFMVAGIYFLRDMLMFVFTKLLLAVRSGVWLALVFCASTAFLSAFLDALTVTAVLITVGVGFYRVYYEVAAGLPFDLHGLASDDEIMAHHREGMARFRAFLRSLMMHSLVGSALGGVCTIVGEPQNLLIAERMGWGFFEFFVNMAPVTMPALAAGLLSCVALERFGWFGFGASMPETVRKLLEESDRQRRRAMQPEQRVKILLQGAVAVLLAVALAMHWAPVGLIGLALIVLSTALTGVTEEHRQGQAFHEALPFTALLTVFFAIVAVINDLQLFRPFMERILELERDWQPAAFFAINGVLSAISDNVFVATVYISQTEQYFRQGLIDRAMFEALAVAINTGTNLPSVATPNGQAALLFLLTSPVAPLIQLSYGRMVWMALPYTIVLTAVGLATVAVLP